MKSILWVTAIAPCFDAGGGGEIRQAHLLKALAERFEVRLLLAGALHDDRVRGLLQSVTELPVAPAGDPVGQLRRRLRDIHWQLVQRHSDEIARHQEIRKVLSKALRSLPEPELVCVEYIGLAPLLPRRKRAFWALTLHNLPSQMARHNARLAPGPRQRAMLALERRNSKRIECRAAAEFDLVVAVSAEDAAALTPEVAVVPNGVDLARFHLSAVPGAPRVVFTGALHTLPNRDGIEWFCRDIWPRIRTLVPDAALDVVGARPPAEIIALARVDGVTVHADVPDTAPFLEHARVAVVPLRIGSGSRLKALEAMAAGRPVVGTGIGLGGLSVLPGRDVLVADDAEGFAQAVATCLSDDGRAGRLARAGRACVEQSYTWERIGRDYAALLDERSEG